jgi:flagellin
MGLRIASNVQALTAQRNLNVTAEANSASMEKLASGYRINKAADDSAGLAISEKLKADVRGLNMARRNASDGVSLIQTAEGGLNEVGNILSRLRELAVQGASDTVGDTERGFLNQEFSQLKNEITRISLSTEYNGTLLIGGDLSEADENLKTRSNAYPLEIQIGKNYFSSLDSKETAAPINVLRVDLQDINSSVGEKGLNLGEDPEDGAHVASKEAAQMTINRVDDAITKVSGYRSTLGALQNRLNSAMSNLSVQAENANAANSRIRDTDFADESARLTQTNILKQSGVAVLAQANQTPQLALRLLG